MTINDKIGSKCVHKVAIDHKVSARKILGDEEKHCRYECNGLDRNCEGYRPLEDVENPNDILFNQHLHPQR